jgi:hypothetical protein
VPVEKVLNQPSQEIVCHHTEDWGNPLGGVEPCDEQGNSITTPLIDENLLWIVVED